MKRLLFLSMFMLCFSVGYGQVSKMKQTSRIPLDSVAMQASKKSKLHDVQVIDGSQNVQTRAGGQAANTNVANVNGQQVSPFAANVGQRTIPEGVKKNVARGSNAVQKGSISDEPQSVFIERKRDQMQVRSAISRSHAETMNEFIRETPQLKISQPERQFRIDTIETDHLNMTHIKGIQKHRNIPVYGMYFTFHISDESERFMGCTVDTALINSDIARLTEDDAIRVAEQDLSLTAEIQKPDVFMKKTMNYERPSVEAIYYPNGENMYNLSYKVVVRPNLRDRWIYYVDAVSGEVVDKYNATTSNANTGSGKDLSGATRTIGTYLENGVHYMVNASKSMFNPSTFSGIIGIYDAKNDIKFHEGKVDASLCTNNSTSWNNPTAISSMYHATLVYDYLEKTHKRKSFDNKGSDMTMIINLCDPKDGNGYDNAYWNGAYVALGNGRTDFLPLAGGLDVIAHEYGHAVVDFTADLEYRNQSGAVNETFADIFGAMVDRANWQIGEKVIKDKKAYPTGALRDMSNPRNGGRSLNDDCWQPAHVSEMYLGTGDNGGVHINSGITNHAYYLYATATSKERAEQVFYRALTTYLRPTSKFIDLRKAVIQSAKDLNFSSDVQTLGNAFDKVGIVDATDEVTPPPANLPTNPGGWGMLICSMDNDRNTLYKTTDYKTLTPISQTEMYSTPTVTDDGKYTYFIDNKNNIRRKDMATGAETTIDAAGDNQSVAISRDGKRIAVISTYEDGYIYVSNINPISWKAFKLYNPTTGSGSAKAGGPRFADAIEFDHSGEYIIYDAYNVVSSSLGGRKLEYWDIGSIHVWDNNRNTWGTGEVNKLFTDLTPGVNVMNPVLSKNSPFIMALDYYDEEDGNFTFLLNLVNGDIDGFTNNMPSYPSYSMDDKHIAFTTYSDNYYVGYFNLGADKITVTGNPVGVASGSGYPVYYGTGTRVLGTKPVANFSADDRSGGAPLLVKFVDMSDGNPTSWRWTFQGGSPSSSTQQHPEVVYRTPGTYYVTLVATNSYGSSDEVRKNGYITVGNDFKFGQRVSTIGSSGLKADPAAAENTDLTGGQVTVFPNPASDVVWITSGANKAKDVKLYDLTGKAQPATFTAEQERLRLDITRLPRGIYSLHITLSDGAIQTRKLIKN